MTINKDFTAITFDDAKKKIIDFLRNSGEFSDYEFTGSRLNTLIDAWAYTVIYSGAYANPAVFESFLLTARDRKSVVIGAQSQGYIPSSKRSSTINVELNLVSASPTPPSFVKIPKNFSFFGQLGSSSFEFVTTEDKEILGTGGVYNSILPISQGKFIRIEQTWDAGSRIFIKDGNIDRNFIEVTVNGVVFTKSESAVRVSSTDRVYYFRETVEGWTEIYFGTGEFENIGTDVTLSKYVGGIRPTIGDTVVVEYLSTKGAEANFITDFKVVDNIDGDYSISVTIPENEVSTGGGDKQDIESIRLLAPKKQESQDRAVTATDYETLILDKFGSIVKNVKAWTIPGKTGYAFIVIRPHTGLVLPVSQINEIESYLIKKNVTVATPKIVDSTYVFIDHTIELDVDISSLTITEDKLKQAVLTSINDYYEKEVTGFDSGFHKSKLLPYIDNTDSSILGSSCDIKVVKEFNKSVFWNNVNSEFMGDFIKPREFSSKEFKITEEDETYTVHIDSTDSGYLVMGPFPNTTEIFIGFEYNLDDFDSKINNTDVWYNIGEIDYEKGTFSIYDFDDITLINFNKDSIVDSVIKFTSPIEESDVYPVNGELIVYEPRLRPEYTTINITTIVK